MGSVPDGDSLASILFQIRDGSIDAWAEGSTSPIPRLLAAIEAILQRHVQDEAEPNWCKFCGHAWPCVDYRETAAALLGEEADDG